MRRRTLESQILAGAVVAVLVTVAAPVVYVALDVGTSAVRSGLHIRALHMGAVALIAPQASSAGVEIETACPDASSLYLGDEDRVRQILVILLSNAVKFTDAGGTITVSCGTSTTPDEEATLVGDGPWTFIRVADTGIGISATEAETVFQPFVQADPGNTRRQGGAGLGLFLIARTAQQFIINVDPGVRSEVIGLWVLDRNGLRAQSSRHSLHFFEKAYQLESENQFGRCATGTRGPRTDGRRASRMSR